ncbi:uncharacterized protein LOC128209582 isoform X2 [Mya arenaria]|uniref:uncharacterized protein LOC128209582 isoform X2 n=1 Tax=Mya arenaria TaxID=6604 RepID=UPI0022E140C8|nr:uncharacterized protein LOC128209582 isoform X2 [Mya arenaria]
MSSASGSLGWTWKGHLAYYDYQTKTEKQFKKVPKLKASVYGAVNQFKAEGMPEDIMAHPELSASDSDADMIDAFQILNDEITRSYHEYERRQKRGLAPVDH